MRRKAILFFVVGMLCGALILGGGLFALQATSSAQAQTAAKWQVTKSYIIGDWGKGGADDPAAWVKSQPTTCDLMPVYDSAFVSFYYRCSK